MNDPFWLDKPEILLSKFEVIPRQTMTNSERLNALTRLLLIITGVMYLMEMENYKVVFVLGIILILVLRSTKCENFSPRRGNHDPCHNCGMDSRLSYINTKYETTPIDQYTHLNDGLRSYTHAHYNVIPQYVPAPYREVWRNEPRYCNEYVQHPKSYEINKPYRYIPTARCNYQDTQWVDNTPVGSGCGGTRKQSVMPATQSAFLRDSMIYRNNIMGDYIDQIERTRQHNCADFKPGRKTF